MDGFAGYSYYFRGRIALRRVPAEVYRFHDDAVHAVAEGVTDRMRRPNGKPQPRREERLGSRYTEAPFVGEAPPKIIRENDNPVRIKIEAWPQRLSEPGTPTVLR